MGHVRRLRCSEPVLVRTPTPPRPAASPVRARQSGTRRAGLRRFAAALGIAARLALAAAALSLAVASAGSLHSAPTSAGQVPVSQITLSMSPVGDISPLIYGVNYDWDRVPEDEFLHFAATMREVAHYTLARYPGGWDAERYDWASNDEVDWQPRSGRRGIDPGTFLSVVPKSSFVIPSAEAIRDPSRIPEVVQEAVELVRRFGTRVNTWEIGNEWWLQGGAKRQPEIRQVNLAGYAKLLAAVAPALKALNAGIEIYATGDWTEPGEFATLRGLVGPRGWSTVDGISLHTYCGNVDPERLCSEIPERADAIRAITGKQKLYASEWSVARKLTSNDYGIRNANEMVAAIQDLALAHMTAAAYWPPARALPAITFVSYDFRRPYATGLLFGLMSQYYRGQALRTVGELPAAAARSGGSVTLVIASMDSGHRMVHLPLAGTGLTRVSAAEVMVAADPDDPNQSRFVQVTPLQTKVGRDAAGQSAVEFELNPGTPGRGSGWEIARVTLR